MKAFWNWLVQHLSHAGYPLHDPSASCEIGGCQLLDDGYFSSSPEVAQGEELRRDVMNAMAQGSIDVQFSEGIGRRRRSNSWDADAQTVEGD